MWCVYSISTTINLLLFSNYNTFAQIKWRKRISNQNYDNFHCTVNGTDSRVQEKKNFRSDSFSYKLYGDGIMYEIGLSIRFAGVLRVNGPFQVWNAYLYQKV